MKINGFLNDFHCTGVSYFFCDLRTTKGGLGSCLTVAEIDEIISFMDKM